MPPFFAFCLSIESLICLLLLKLQQKRDIDELLRKYVTVERFANDGFCAII